MPQLDVSTFPTQLTWLALTFVLLYVLMTKVALPAVGGVLEERQKTITESLDKTAQLKAEAETVLAAYEQSLAAARIQAQLALRETADRIAAEAAERQHALAERLAHDIKAAETRIETAKQKALEGVRSLAIDVAKAATSHLIGVAVADQQVAAAVDAAAREQS